MQASKKITIAIVSIYSVASMALALAMFYQSKTDVERETASAMQMADSLVQQGIPVATLKPILDLNRHLTTETLTSDQLTAMGTPPSGLVYADPNNAGQHLFITPNPKSEMAEIQATVLSVFGIFLLSLLLTLKSLRVAIKARLKPLQSLCQALSSIPKGDYHVEVVSGDINEINDLIEHYKAMAKGLDKKERQVIALRTRLADLMENERRSLARELHDNLGQLVTAIAVQSYMLGQQSQNPFFVKKYAKDIQQQCDEIQNCLRSITNQLYPVALSRVGLLSGLQDLCESWQRTHRIEVQFSVSGMALQSDIDRDTHIYRIAQEALNNIAKHADAQSTQMNIKVSSDTFYMRIEDNGVGMAPGFTPDADTLGMASMQDRASLIAANIQFDTSKQGVIVELSVPLLASNQRNIEEGDHGQYLIGG